MICAGTKMKITKDNFLAPARIRRRLVGPGTQTRTSAGMRTEKPCHRGEKIIAFRLKIWSL